MPWYVKACPLSALRRFDAFSVSSDAELEGDDPIVYLHEDLRVTAEIDGAPLFEATSDSWRRFCTAELGFAVPDWEAESRRAREALADGGAE